MIFWTLTTLCCAYAGLVGGKLERLGAVLFIATAAASYLAEYVCVSPPATWERVNVA